MRTNCGSSHLGAGSNSSPLRPDTDPRQARRPLRPNTPPPRPNTPLRLDTHPPVTRRPPTHCAQNEWHTPVKTVPSPILRMRSAKTLPAGLKSNLGDFRWSGCVLSNFTVVENLEFFQYSSRKAKIISEYLYRNFRVFSTTRGGMPCFSLQIFSEWGGLTLGNRALFWGIR